MHRFALTCLVELPHLGQSQHQYQSQILEARNPGLLTYYQIFSFHTLTLPCLIT